MFDDLQAKQRAAFLKRWPTEVLAEKSALLGLAIDSLEFARRMDVEDEFRRFRQLFSFPKKMDLPNGKCLVLAWLFKLHVKYNTMYLLDLVLSTWNPCNKLTCFAQPKSTFFRVSNSEKQTNKQAQSNFMIIHYRLS